MVLDNGQIVWVANYPYGYCNPYEPHEVNIRPSKRTMKAFRDYIDFIGVNMGEKK